MHEHEYDTMSTQIGRPAYEAMMFAMRMHKDHKRKYTNEPYFTHLSDVVGILSSFRKDPYSLSIAWLHDCMEDIGVPYDLINYHFGRVVADGVLALSDLEQGNRAERKKASRERLSASPSWIQDIKCCDLISNTLSIRVHDPKFAVTYLEEKRLLLEVLDKANKDLLDIAWSYCK